MTGLAVLMLSACGQQTPQREPLTGGDPARGQALIVHAGCGSCHTIEGVEGANSLVGPPLTGLRQRTYIGGVAANSATNLERWLMHPQAFSPRTAMPDLGLTEDQARDIAAYLYLH
jgi:cytochrome c2